MADDPVSPDRLTGYVAEAIARASRVYASRPVTDPQHALALGEAVALFNLADEFGLVRPVRDATDQLIGRDAYAALSAAMKNYYLGLPAQTAPATGHRPTSRPRHGRPGRPSPRTP